MPFTFSHPAIVLPFARTKLCLTGLIAGSLTPDFEYFFRMKIQSDFSHSYLGGIYFGLPIGLLICFVFHQMIKNKLIQNLPRRFQLKFGPILKFNWFEHFKRNWLIVILSVLLGTYSHIFWDSFTHQNAYFVNVLNLNEPFGNTNYPMFKILQHSSTVLGGLYILYYISRMEDIYETTTKPDLTYWSIFILLTCSILAIRIYTGLNISQYGNVIVSGISASMIALVLVSIIVKDKKATT